MGASTLRTWVALLLLVAGGPGPHPASLATAAIDDGGGGGNGAGEEGGNGSGAAVASASCPIGCVCSVAEVSCRNVNLEDAPVGELQAAASAGRDWSGITKL